MSIKSKVAHLWLNQDYVAHRPAQTYTVAAPGPAYDLFNITGPVHITCLGGRVTAVAVGATTIRLTVNGINVDAGAVAINGAVGTVFLSCLNVAGALVNAAGIPMTAALLHPRGFVAGVQPAAAGVIVGTFAVGTNWTGDIFCVFRKLAPDSDIILA